MKVSVTVFEGSPEEYEVFARVQQRRGQGTGDLDPSGPERGNEAELFAFFRKVFTRKKPSYGQKQLLKALFEAGEEGLTSEELSKTMGRRPDQLAGVLGALGRRTQNTDGVVALERSGRSGIEHLLEIEPRGDQQVYRLRPETRQFLADEGDDLRLLQLDS